MTNLDCAVTNCLYNSEKCCCKGDIKVQGQAAESISETCCGSFVERKENVGKTRWHSRPDRLMSHARRANANLTRV